MRQRPKHLLLLCGHRPAGESSGGPYDIAEASSLACQKNALKRWRDTVEGGGAYMGEGGEEDEETVKIRGQSTRGESSGW